MAATTLTDVPAMLIAGDTLLFTKSLSDYQSPTWTLSFKLRKSGEGVIEWTGTDNGDGKHLFAIAAQDTAAYPAGNYYAVGFVTSGAQRFKVWDGFVEVKPDYASQNDLDPRTDNARILDKLKAAFETLAESTADSVSVEGVSYTRRNMESLQRMIDIYQSRVDAERLNTDQTDGKYSRRIVMRFTRP